jgi:hypothetical protein
MLGGLILVGSMLPLGAGASPEADALKASASALEASAVKLHQAYAVWLRQTGRFEGRGADGFYSDLCSFRNSCRAVAWQIRSKEVPHVSLNQVERIEGRLKMLNRHPELRSVDPSVQELMRDACTVACSFRGACDSLTASEASGLANAVVHPQKNPPRVGPLRLIPNRFDIMSCLENRCASR